MNKIAVIFWTGTGNTEVMANEVVAGAKEAGADVTLFQPLYDQLKAQISGKKVVLFGSYGWGGGEWMNPWKEDAANAGLVLADEPLAIEGAPDDAGKEKCRELGKVLALS